MNRGPRDGAASETTTAPPATDELAARRERLGGPHAPTVLVVDSVADRIASLRHWEAKHGGAHLLFAQSSTAAIEIAAREQPEVAVIDLLFREGRGIALAVELARVAPEIEVLFIVDDGAEPEVQAAWDLGWNRLVASDALADWMDRGLRPLAQLVSLKRQVASVRHDTLRLAAGNVVPEVAELPLGVAERRYRETFLRSKLAMAGGRREAARLAGVPYTTFCVMLRKLGIRS
jgi:CheY-like chemotaxis protein